MSVCRSFVLAILIIFAFAADTPQFLSGYAPVIEGSSSAIFWLFYPMRNPTNTTQKTPIILFLQGGPGSSSGSPNFFQFGPNLIVKDQNGEPKEQRRKDSWNDHAHLLYLDQPISTGYSILEKEEDLPRSIEQVVDQLFNGLSHIFKGNLKEYAGNPLYVVGASIGSKYSLVLAKKDIELRKAGKEGLPVSIRGVVLGGGVVDPINILPTFGPFAQGSGLIGQEYRKVIDFQERTIRNLMEKEEWLKATKLFWKMVRDTCQAAGGASYQNIYERGEYDLSLIINYLNKPETIRRFGAKTNRFNLTSPLLFESLSEDFMKSEVETCLLYTSPSPRDS
eukprot:TRINITY_DN19912_c0_g1_i2.p1 TRINITY_DN19912_c0_g1~~TRINITY_DN19912_c0_g1_i2.p1  ORF type:complete len:336 (+),score=86.80 TRINITY_DN19912_c0_g1_i2:54-1061(+)